jgi:hypothetical protein
MVLVVSGTAAERNDRRRERQRGAGATRPAAAGGEAALTFGRQEKRRERERRMDKTSLKLRLPDGDLRKQ